MEHSAKNRERGNMEQKEREREREKGKGRNVDPTRQATASMSFFFGLSSLLFHDVRSTELTRVDEEGFIGSRKRGLLRDVQLTGLIES